MSNVLIIGKLPIKECIAEQFRNRGMEVLDNPTLDEESNVLTLNEVSEIVLLPFSNNSIEEDNRTIAKLKWLESLDKNKNQDTERRTVHLMLLSQTSLCLLQNNNLVKELSQHFDIYPFTLQNEWAKRVIQEMALPNVPIDVKSERYQHIVIFGMGETAEALAINAALTFHYPNYIHNHKLRSRITMVSSDMEQMLPKLLQRYEHLFQHSYYRVVNPHGKLQDKQAKMIISLHKPENMPMQEDYVDIEWEFVIADHNDVVLREKLSSWANSRLQQNLNIVCATEDDEMNLSMALHLPDAIYDRSVPVYVKQTKDALVKSVDLSANKYKNIVTYGMDTSGYDVALPLVRMGQIVNDVYCQCYNDNYVEADKHRGSLYNAIAIDDNDMFNRWQSLNMVKRHSCIFNALTVRVKLYAVGINEEEWNQCYDLPETKVGILAEVEHNRWNVEELILGFRPCTETEQEAIERDISLKEEYKKRRIHYDIRAYQDLRKDETGKNVNVYDVVLTRSLPLIVAEYMKKGR